MRGFRALAALIFLFSVVTHACEIYVSVTSLEGGTDPIRATDWSTKRLLTLTYDTLVRFENEGSLAPGLAQRWYFSEDKKKIVFHLQPDRYFSDGSVVDAASVVRSLRRYVGPESVDRDRLASVKDFKVIDERTFEMQLDRPNVVLIYYLATPRSGIVKPTSKGLLGSGPWVSVRHTSTKGYFARNPHRVIREGECQKLEVSEQSFGQSLDLFAKEKLDIIEYVPPETVAQAGFPRENMIEIPAYDVSLLLFTLNAKGGLSAAERRWLLRKVRSSLPLVGKSRRPACTLLPLGVLGSIAAPCPELSGDDGPVLKPKKVEIFVPTSIEDRRALMSELAAMLAREKVQLVTHFLNLKELKQLHAKGKVSLHFEIFTSQIPDAFGILSMYRKGAGENFSGYANPKFDELLNRALSQSDAQARIALYHEAIGHLSRDAMVIPLVHESRQTLVSKRVENYLPSYVGPYYTSYHELRKREGP